MRNKYYFSLFMCFFAWIMYNGVTSSSGKSGKSGAPGENTCIQCHGGNTLNDPAGSIAINIAGVTNGQYTAGQTYQVSVTVSKVGQSLFGFSVSALNQAGQNAGSLVAGTDNHAELSSESGTSRNYITHNSNGGLSANQKTFTFSWTAPASGNVNFYFTGLAANNNGGTTGDFVYSSSLSLTQSTVTPSRIIAGEYFWGTIDPGVGTGTAFTATDGNFSDVIESIIASAQSVPNLSSPVLLNVRVKDVNNNWGPRFRKVIFLNSNTPTANNVVVTQGEFFFGSNDPGQGNATPLVVFDGNWGEAVEAATSMNTTWSLAPGMHLFNIRAKDGSNKWGPLFKKSLSVQSVPSNARLCKIQSAEFFFGATDPGQGNGTNLLVLDDNWSDAIETVMSNNTTWSLSNGLTLFNVRVKDETNQWGPLFKKTLSIQGPPSFRNLTVQAAEFFFGTFDPGAGSATSILAFDGDYNAAIEQAFADDYAWSITGNSALFNIRFKDESNQWGPLFKKTVFKNETPNGRLLNITFAEYYFGVFDPGAGNGSIIVAFDGNFDNAIETLLRDHLTWENQSGSTLFNIRAKDGTNKWGPVFKRTIFFNGANPAVNLITQGETVSRCPTFPVTLTYAGPQGFNVTWENGTVGNTVTFVPDGSGYFSMTAQLGNEYLFDSIYVNVYELPPAVVDPTGEILVCQSSTVYLNVNTASNYSYQWYFNDAVIPGSTQPTILPTEVGAYKVLVTNNTTTCQQMSLPTTFYLTAPIFPSGTVSTVCNPNGVTLTAPTSPSNTYQWKKNGANISGATSSTYLATTPGNYQVTVNSGACVSTSPVTTVTSTGTSVVAAILPSGTQNLCTGQVLTLNATTGTGYTFQWNKDGVAINGATQSSYIADAPGVYTCTVSANGCTLISNATTINLGDAVVPSVSIVANNTTVCSGTGVNFTATPTNGGTTPTYQWKKNGVNISGATSSTYTLAAPANNDAISVVMTSNNSCQSTNTSNSNSVTVTVTNSVTPTVAITSGTTSICAGTSVQFTSSITNGGTTPAYQWKKNGVNISGATLSSYTTTSLVNSDVITLQLTSNASCVSSATATSNAITMTVNASVAPSVSISANNTTVCAGSSVNFTATPTNGGTTPTYQWKKNGVNISGATSSTYTLAAPVNNDAIIVVMTSNAACATTASAVSNSVSIIVNQPVTYYQDLDGDGFGNLSVSTSQCTQPLGYVLVAGDCADNSSSINPGSPELCYNGLDDNCSNAIDEGCSILGCTDANACNYNPDATDDDQSCVYPELYYNCESTCLNDQDGDGVCDELEILGCNNPNACNFNPLATDNDGSCIAAQLEICNQLDDDCDGVVDNGVQYFDYYQDNDGDGFGDFFLENTCIEVTDPLWVLASGDCQDENADVYPTQLEACNSQDDNCNGQIDEGVSPGSIQAVSVITNAFPTCAGNGMKSANFAVGADSPITSGSAIDLWYSFTAQHASFRAGLSAAFGDNAIELYVQQGNCMVMIESEHEVTSGNQILYNDDLILGTTYYVACRHFSGPNNPSAKICFNHFLGSTCDHYYSNNTGVYNSVCTAFKASYRANAAQYAFGVESASQNGQPLVITPWVYTTTSTNSVVSRLGMILPVNNTGLPVVYGMKVGVVYAMTDAAGNSESVVAAGTLACQTTLNSEATISLRSVDRCPSYKSVTGNVSVDRTVCGAQRYQWEFTQVLPTAAAPVTVLGGLYSAVLFLNNVPGMGPGKTFNVRVRAQHSSGTFGSWGSVQCLRTLGSGMALQGEVDYQFASDQSEHKFAIYPNPALSGQFSLIWETSAERLLNLKVWDLSGKLVAEQSEFMEGHIWESKQMDLANGIYFVEVNGQRQRWVIAQ